MKIRRMAARTLVGLSLLSGVGCDYHPTAFPAVITSASGGLQTVAVGAPAAKPLVVTVKDQEGDAIDGVTVVWNINSGGGTLSASTSKTDDDGRASVTFTAPSTAGSTRITATLPELGASVIFTMTVQ